MENSNWKTRETLPKDGRTIYVQSVYGTEPDDGKIFFEGEARFGDFTTKEVRDPITNEVLSKKNTMKRWIDCSTGKCVAGRIVRWNELNTPNQAEQNSKETTDEK